MLQSLAIAVVGGLLSSIVLSLFLTPAIYYYLGRIGAKTAPEAAPEPA